jgi:arylsulfatase A
MKNFQNPKLKATWSRLALCLFSLAVAFQSSAAPCKKPNIVFILVDDLGYGDLKSFNPESKIPTPHLDQLAAQSLRFTDAHAAGPLCHVSRYGLLTGSYPFRTQVGEWSKRAVIEPDQWTIASLLKSQGYSTAMVGKWHLGFDEKGYDQPLPGGPVDRGFDSYFGIRASTDIPPYFYIRNQQAVLPPTLEIEANDSEGWSPIQGAFWRKGGIAPDLKLEEVLPRFTEEAIQIIQNHGRPKADSKSDQPLFLYLAYPAPHTPWLPSQEFIGKSGAGLYGDFTMMVDSMIGRVLSAVEDTGMSDDTLVFFSSDNGPVWYDRDVDRFQHDSTGGLRGMKADGWEGGHRMPFMARWPGVVNPGTSTDALISFVDIMATLAEILEVELPSDQALDSFSFASTLLSSGKGASSKPRPPLLVQSGNGTPTVRAGDWKFINQLGSGGFSEPRRLTPEPNGPQGQLYNLKSDPKESKNLWLENSEMVEEISKEMDRILKSKSTRMLYSAE